MALLWWWGSTLALKYWFKMARKMNIRNVKHHLGFQVKRTRTARTEVMKRQLLTDVVSQYHLLICEDLGSCLVYLYSIWQPEVNNLQVIATILESNRIPEINLRPADFSYPIDPQHLTTDLFNLRLSQGSKDNSWNSLWGKTFWYR